MKKFISIMLLSTMFLTSCGGGGGKTTQGSTKPGDTMATVSGADSSTGTKNVYKYPYSGEVETLNYLIDGSTNNVEVAANVIDTLVDYDEYGVLVPGLAESWELADDGITWTFKIKEGLKWVNHKGEIVADVVANDWVTAAEFALNPANGSTSNSMMTDYIVNADVYADDEAADIDFSEVGVKALDANTLQYTSTGNVPYFLSLLSYGPYLPAQSELLTELGLDYGLNNESIYYCGAYYLAEWNPQNNQLWKKNEHYWDKDKIHLVEIQRKYNSELVTLGPTLFLNEDADRATISSEILDEWLNDPEKSKYLVTERPSNSYSYFYSFNFDPNFDKVFEPDNWKKAASNLNFRKSIFHGLNRINAMTALQPKDPERLIINTLSTPDFAILDGVDYVTLGGLKHFTETDSFDEALAKEFKDLAIPELTAAGVTFPIKILMPFNPISTGWDKECILVEQQLEELLGADYIDIIVEAGPSTGFLSEVRRSGKYALMKCNWGADYDDPRTWADPMASNNTYNFMYKAEDPVVKTVVDSYYTVIDSLSEMIETPGYSAEERYLGYAEAESILLENAFIIPYSRNQIVYQVTRINVFDGEYAPFGIATLRFKGQKIIDEPINLEQFNKNYEDWLVAKEKALLAAAENN